MSLAAEGASVIVTGRRGEVAAEIAAGLDRASWIEVDLTLPGAGRQLVDHAFSQGNTIDILILNSGGPKIGPAATIDRESYLQALEFLVLQHIEITKAVVPSMIERGWGRIVGIGSTSIQNPNPDLALSAVIRSSLAAYLKILSREIAHHGITVNMVHPGRIDTERVRSIDVATAERQALPIEQVQAQSRSSIPMGRYGKVEEFGALVAFLASEQAGYINGEQIRVDGGKVQGY
jgi:3-oxoacyl-[acyl-carrier protein] reductase